MRWIESQGSQTQEVTIKDWVFSTIGNSTTELTAADLREGFQEKFGDRWVASLRQYLAKPLGLVDKKDGKLKLSKNGKAEH